MRFTNTFRSAFLSLLLAGFGYAPLALASAEEEAFDEVLEQLQLLQDEGDDLRTGADVLVKTLGKAETLIGNAKAVAESYGSSKKGKAVAYSLGSARSSIGDAKAVAVSGAFTHSKKLALAKSIAHAVTDIGNAKAVAVSMSHSEGGPAIAVSIAVAVSAIGDATAVAKSTATSG